MKKYQKIKTKISNPFLKLKENPPLTINSLNLITTFTNICNLHCIMCKKSFSKNLNKLSMGKKVFDEILKIIPYAKTLNLRTGGEPLLTPDIIQKIKLIKSINPNIKIKINTNGLPLNNEEFALSVMENIDSLHLSLNGIKSYDKIMKPAKFKDIINVMNMIKRLKHQIKNDLKLMIGFIIMKMNYKEITDVVDLAAKYGFQKIIYKTLIIYHKSLLKKSINTNNKLYQKVIYELSLARKKAAKSNITACYDDILKMDSSLNKFTYTDFCSYPWDTIFININGDISLCCTNNTLIDNILNDPLEKIWNCNEAIEYRKGILEKKYYKGCGSCRKIILEDD
ncbi:MAG: radical SAM protein [Spirochaetes bacterium]|nr:radical SAM protein [Spirochaetota bacterium]